MVLWIREESQSVLHEKIFEKIKKSELIDFCKPVIKKVGKKVFLITDIEDYRALMEIISDKRFFEAVVSFVNDEEEAIVILNESYPFDVGAFQWAIVKPAGKSGELLRELLFDLFIYYSPCNIIEYILELPEEVKEFIKSVEYRGDVAIIKSDALRPLLEMFTERCLKIFPLTV
jgi:hypothetical protein